MSNTVIPELIRERWHWSPTEHTGTAAEWEDKRWRLALYLLMDIANQLRELNEKLPGKSTWNIFDGKLRGRL